MDLILALETVASSVRFSSEALPASVFYAFTLNTEDCHLRYFINHQSALCISREETGHMGMGSHFGHLILILGRTFSAGAVLHTTAKTGSFSDHRENQQAAVQ